MINTKNAEKWFEKYEELKHEERNAYVINTLNQKLDSEFIEEIEIMDFVIEIFAELFRDKRFGEMIRIYNMINDLNPQLKEKDLFYIEKYIIDYYIQNGNKNEWNVEKQLGSFLTNPDKSYDELLIVLKKLSCCGFDEFVVGISEKIFNNIQGSEDLIAGSEIELTEYILMNVIQNIYIDIQNNKIPDREYYLEYMDKYDYNMYEKFDLIFNTLKEDTNNVISSSQNLRIVDILSKLELHFNKYMYGKNINFKTSSDIWNDMFMYFGNNKDIEIVSKNIESIFRIENESYDRHLAEKFGMFTENTLSAMTMVYGMHYVYDFLYENRFITQSMYFESLEIIREKRMLVFKTIGNGAWKYAFIFNWVKADSIAQDEYDMEKEFARKTFYEEMNIDEFMTEEYLKLFEQVRDRERAAEKLIREGKTIKKEEKVERNAPCPCGSGKKYKKCCGK